MKGSVGICLSLITVILNLSEVTSDINGLAKTTKTIILDDLVPQVKLTNAWGPFLFEEYVFDLAQELQSITARNYRINLFLPYSNTVIGGINITATYADGTVKNSTWKEGAERQEIEGAIKIQLQLPENSNGTNPHAVTLFATLYFEESNTSCPRGYDICKKHSECTGDDDDSGESSREYDDLNSETKAKSKYRCVTSDLNNNANACGILTNCDYFYGGGGDSYGDDDHIGWYDVQYLLTILLAGLFFILSPICILIFFYHRRMNVARNIEIERQRAIRFQQGRGPGGQEAGSAGGYTTSPRHDTPPSYEDVHDIKSPPPSFDSVHVPPASRPSEVSGAERTVPDAPQ